MKRFKIYIHDQLLIIPADNIFTALEMIEDYVYKLDRDAFEGLDHDGEKILNGSKIIGNWKRI